MKPIIRSGAALRAGAVLLLVGPLFSWVVEFITAAAWQHPHYAPLDNWVSHLGLTGPRQVAFGQVGTSPLGAVMDTGWVISGVSLIVGTLLTFDNRRGGRAIAIVVVGIVAGNIMAILVGAAASRSMFERGAIYPIMIGHVLLGSGLLAAHRSPALTTRKTA